MDDTFEKLFDKHDLAEDVREEFKRAIDDELLKVFRRLSVQETDAKQGKAKSKTTAVTKKTTTKSKSSGELCAGKKANGEDCAFKAKENGYCGRHDPDRVSTKKSSKPKTKKSTATHECHCIIAKTKKQCTQPGTIKPEGSDFYYCKRHSEKWTEFEPEPDEDLKGSDPEDEDLDEDAEDDDQVEE